MAHPLGGEPLDTLHLVHLVTISVWAGVVLAEGALELGARDDAGRRQIARAHYAIDLWIELPLLLAVLATGAWLVARAWPLTTLHWAKVAVGLVAVAANLVCVGLVVRRQRRAHDSAALLADTRLIRASGLGVPFGIAAAVLGFAYFQV